MVVERNEYDSMLQHIWRVAERKGFDHVMYRADEAAELTGISDDVLYRIGCMFPCSAETLAQVLVGYERAKREKKKPHVATTPHEANERTGRND